MGKSAKFFKRPTRKEKAVLSLTKGANETSLFDSAVQGRNSKKDILSATANPTISKKTSTASALTGGPSGSAHPSKSSLAYKMQLNGGVKQAVKNLQAMDNDDDEELMEEDEDMEEDHDTTGTHSSSQKNNKKKGEMDKTKPRPDYVELMYGKPQSGNKRKSFKPKPALIK
ncbi:hypothetical protein BGX27_004108 [Mortierella sp. AM989]|nr:hypothetical protein BGX27_004108 [Mortierella sp. AM989]